MNKKTKTFAIALLLLVAVVAAGMFVMLRTAHKQAPSAAVTPQKTIYHCPMHPNYLSDKPGTCPICGMKLVPVNEAASETGPGISEGRKILYYRDAMNPSYTSDKPGKAPDGMDLVPVYADEQGSQQQVGTVKIDPVTVQNMGVATETAQLRRLTREIRASATIETSETAVTNVNAKIMGWIDKLSVDYTGQPVKQGQPLLTIYSPDLVSTQEEYLQALRYLNALSGSAADARKGAQELVESSKRRLLNWDIPEDEIKRIETGGTPEKSLTIYSPASGVVLEKSVVAGQNVLPGAELYKIADLSTVWAIASIYQEELPWIKVGMKATIDLPSLPGRTFTGRVAFIAPLLDSTTKTAAVRIAIRNTPEPALRPQMFANVELLSPAAMKTLSVSRQAVLHTGRRDLVIVSLGNGRFKPRDVTLGMNANGYVQVLSGLAEGETIVTSSQFMIDAESNLKEAVGQMSGMEMPMPEQPKKEPKGQDKQSPGDMQMPGMNMK